MKHLSTKSWIGFCNKLFNIFMCDFLKNEFGIEIIFNEVKFEKINGIFCTETIIWFLINEMNNSDISESQAKSSNNRLWLWFLYVLYKHFLICFSRLFFPLILVKYQWFHFFKNIPAFFIKRKFVLQDNNKIPNFWVSIKLFLSFITHMSHNFHFFILNELELDKWLNQEYYWMIFFQ